MRPITERLSPVVRNLVIIDAVLFAFYALVTDARIFFESHLALGPAALLRAEVWQPLTSLFVHIDVVSFVFNIIGLWFVGATVERATSTRRFLIVFFVSGVAANFAMVVVSIGLGRPDMFAGCGASVLALFVAFAVMYKGTPARVLGALVVKANVLTAILIGFALVADVTQGFSRGAWAPLVGDVVAITLGYVLMGGRGQELRRFWVGWRTRRVRRRYQIIEGGRRKNEPRPPFLN
jgi:membrane associated rhomboid family serine protease